MPPDDPPPSDGYPEDPCMALPDPKDDPDGGPFPPDDMPGNPPPDCPPKAKSLLAPESDWLFIFLIRNSSDSLIAV